MTRGHLLLVLLGGLLSGGLACRSPTAPAPVASITRSPQGPVIAAITVVSFQAAPDPSAQTTYAWNFGDGTTAAGSSVTHVFAHEGTVSVGLTATNSGGSANASTPVIVRSLTGLWRPDFFFAPCFTVRLTQVGPNVDAVAINGSAASATVQAPANITLTIAPTPAQNCGAAIMNRSGTFDATLDSFTLVVASTQTDTWRRQ